MSYTLVPSIWEVKTGGLEASTSLSGTVSLRLACIKLYLELYEQQ